MSVFSLQFALSAIEQPAVPEVELDVFGCHFNFIPRSAMNLRNSFWNVHCSRRRLLLLLCSFYFLSKIENTPLLGTKYSGPWPVLGHS